MAQAAVLDFVHYAVVMIPVAVCGVLVNIAVVVVMWRRELV